MANEVSHWSFFQLPPFFTLQPAPASFERQVSLWGNLIMDHAVFHTPLSKPGACSFLRLYKSTSDVFRNQSLNRRLAPSAAGQMLEFLATQQPNHTALVSSGDSKGVALLVATNLGGFKEIEQSLLSWILDRGAGTTTAHLAQSGVVMTFDELASSNCLSYKRDHDPIMSRISHETSIPVEDVATLSDEQAVRTLLQALKSRPVSLLSPFRITFFNLDGTEREPYEGVKFGGATLA
ncbi:ESCRT-II complex [Trypanosoma melophagium]|uniref:ESCRT-II complex n=1 Tax=Trypanosoma melophagium TaxID=715481 RepID=UPI00351A74BE|nr:ESCRT-II complex [Trypanosoma melophagium]